MDPQTNGAEKRLLGTRTAAKYYVLVLYPSVLIKCAMLPWFMNMETQRFHMRSDLIYYVQNGTKY